MKLATRKKYKKSIFLLCIVLSICNSWTLENKEQSVKYRSYKEPVLSKVQQKYLLGLKKRCAESNDGFEELISAGYAYMFLTLAGHLSLQDTAEYYLEKAFLIDSTDIDLNRTLGRFYNIRMVDLDFSKAEMQVRVYRAMLGNKSVDEMSEMEFVSWTFFQMGQAILYQSKKRVIKALGTVHTLEKNIRMRISKEPKNVEFHALGGNFAFFLGGNIPFGKRRRTRKGINYFEYVHDHWKEMRPGARNTIHCPNTYKNFMFELADAYLIKGKTAEAKKLYIELAVITKPRTRPKEIIAEICKERIKNADQYRGDYNLMPPWPSDKGNCIVCHSYNADLPMGSLYSKDPIDISTIPSQAEDKPVLLDHFDEPIDD